METETRSDGGAGGGREAELTFLLLSSHFLFFSGAEEGEDTAIDSLASIGTAQPKLQSIPEGRNTGQAPHAEGERGEGPGGGDGGGRKAGRAIEDSRQGGGERKEDSEEVIYMGGEY